MADNKFYERFFIPKPVATGRKGKAGVDNAYEFDLYATADGTELFWSAKAVVKGYFDLDGARYWLRVWDRNRA